MVASERRWPRKRRISSAFGQVAVAREIFRNRLDLRFGGEKLWYSAILRNALEGRILAGRYRLLSQLGRGGMGSVWRAEHMDLGTPAAVKLIDDTFAQSPEAMTRFRREAQAAASLRSANVVQILDYGVDGETPYIAMELLEGESLADRIERFGQIDPESCVSLLMQVSKALSRAHEQGIVHRDLKPDNIFLSRDGDDVVAKVLDFGIAKRTGALQTSSDMSTRTGSLMGTPYYMSPEQASGRRQVDHRTDIWAFAVIAYEALTGRRPFDDSNLGGLLLSICTESPQPASRFAALPPAFDAWFARCTAKDPAGRFDSIREATAELCRVFGMAMPTSRLTAGAQAGARVPTVPGEALPSAGTVRGDARGASAATPGAVVMPVSGTASVSMERALKRRTSVALLLSGAVAAVGLLSAAGAVMLRSGHTAEPASAGVPSSRAMAASASLATIPSVSSANVQPTIAVVPTATTRPEEPGIAPQAVPSSGRGSVAPANNVAAKRSGARTVAPRQTVRQLRGRDVDGSAPQPYRPQDRLERDLGF